MILVIIVLMMLTTKAVIWGWCGGDGDDDPFGDVVDDNSWSGQIALLFVPIGVPRLMKTFFPPEDITVSSKSQWMTLFHLDMAKWPVVVEHCVLVYETFGFVKMKNGFDKKKSF